jgi:hypothetical protein
MFSNVEIERIIEAFIYEQNRLQGDDPFISLVQVISLPLT